MGGAHHRFYRRVVEIRDGLVQLSPYYTTPTAGPGSVGGMAVEREEVRWARLIREALVVKAAGGPVVEADPVLVPGGDELESDARLLTAIAGGLANR